MSILEESLEHSKDNNPENSQVNIYFRLANSKSIKIRQPAEQSVSSLKKRVTEAMGIHPEHQILYYKGKELAKDKILSLVNNSIIHVKSTQQIDNGITVQFIKHLPQNHNIFKLNPSSTPLSVQPTRTIWSVLEQLLQDASQTIDVKRTKVIECGRFLNLKKTFLQEKIQTQTQIHLILRKPKDELAAENEEDNRIFIESVLKSSRQNSLTDRQPKLITGLEDAKEKPRKKPNKQMLRSQEIEHNQELLHAQGVKQLRKSDTFHQPFLQHRKSLPNYYTPTKSSEHWQSQKVIRKEVTPLKFSFREYKKYEGPKSLRQCNCKRKEEFYMGQGQAKTQGEPSTHECSSPYPCLKKVHSKLSIA